MEAGKSLLAQMPTVHFGRGGIIVWAFFSALRLLVLVNVHLNVASRTVWFNVVKKFGGDPFLLQHLNVKSIKI